MFISDKFIFNGVHSDDMGVALISFESNILNRYGLNFNRGISLDNGGRDMSHFVQDSDNIEEIELNIALIDSEFMPIAWDDETIMHITSWLITDSFVEFISEDNIDLTYYLKTTKIVKHFNHKKEGYLQVTLQPFSNYAYIKYSENYTFNNPDSFTIKNLSNLNEMYKPILQIKNLGDTSNVIVIENTSLGSEPFIIEGLSHNEVVRVDSLLGTVYNDRNENLLMKCNRKWLTLIKNENVINVSGNVEIDIKCQFPVIL